MPPSQLRTRVDISSSAPSSEGAPCSPPSIRVVPSVPFTPMMAVGVWISIRVVPPKASPTRVRIWPLHWRRIDGSVSASGPITKFSISNSVSSPRPSVVSSTSTSLRAAPGPVRRVSPSNTSSSMAMAVQVTSPARSRSARPETPATKPMASAAWLALDAASPSNRANSNTPAPRPKARMAARPRTCTAGIGLETLRFTGGLSPSKNRDQGAARKGKTRQSVLIPVSAHEADLVTVVDEEIHV